MPRGRLPTSIVAMTSRLSPSMTVIELPFSLETKISRAWAGRGGEQRCGRQQR